MQYALRQRARELGWHEADIDVIDADLGMSGASAAQRSGFKLVGRVGLSESTAESDPLARRLFTIDLPAAGIRSACPAVGAADCRSIRSPADEPAAELDFFQHRGDIARHTPSAAAGCIADPLAAIKRSACPWYARSGQRLRLVFEMFLKLSTVAKVMRMLNDRGLDLPRRDRHGDLRWTRATVVIRSGNPRIRLMRAPVDGRTRMRTAASDGVSRAKVPRPVEEWRIVVKDRYPAYIDWPTYGSRTVIRDNRAESCAPKPEARRATAISCCTASPGATRSMPYKIVNVRCQPGAPGRSAELQQSAQALADLWPAYPAALSDRRADAFESLAARRSR